MREMLSYSILLVAGLVGSQVLPTVLSDHVTEFFDDAVRILSMICLCFIMIRVGYEFDIDKSNLKQYGWDYVVAFTAATFPHLLVGAYFVFVMLPPVWWWEPATWKETLLAARFAAPTSAGVLFAMLLASGLGATWLFRKARILAIFDDLDTVLLMIPLKMLIIGFAWQLGLAVVVMVGLIVIAYTWLHRVRLPISWEWVLVYSCVIAVGSEMLYQYSKVFDETIPIHIEVLLPGFVLGCIIAYPNSKSNHNPTSHPEISTPREQRVARFVSGFFMVLVGLSMPALYVHDPQSVISTSPSSYETLHTAAHPTAVAAAAKHGGQVQVGQVTSSQPPLGWGMIIIHTLVVTVLSNLGKMFPALCYRREAHWRERLAVAISMWPRGEVGAGILVISLSYGIGGPIVTVAMLSLALNLLMTGLYIYSVKWLTRDLPGYQANT